MKSPSQNQCRIGLCVCVRAQVLLDIGNVSVLCLYSCKFEYMSARRVMNDKVAQCGGGPVFQSDTSEWFLVFLIRIETLPPPLLSKPDPCSNQFFSRITPSILGALSHVILTSFVLYVRVHYRGSFRMLCFLGQLVVVYYYVLYGFTFQLPHSLSHIVIAVLSCWSNIWWTTFAWCLSCICTNGAQSLCQIINYFCLFARPMNFPPWREPRFYCWWPVKRVTSIPLPPANSSPWSPVKRAKPWSKRASIPRTHHLGPTPPQTNVWVQQDLRRRTSPTRCLSRRAWATLRWGLESGKLNVRVFLAPFCCCKPHLKQVPRYTKNWGETPSTSWRR